MTRVWVRCAVAALGLVAGCSKAKEPENDPAPIVRADLPDPLTLDWRNLVFELGALGSVHAVDGHGVVGADGSLYVDPPALVDLDGDRHEEAVIPFVLDTGAPVYGAFVFTLRDGKPVQLGAIATTSKPGFTIDGASIRTTEGVVWRWDKATRSLARTP